MKRTRVWTSSLRQLGIDVGAVDDDVLDEHARLDLVALEIGGEHVDAELAPFHRVELDRHRQVVIFHRAQRRRHAVHAGDQGLALAVGGIDRLHGAERHVVVGGVDGGEIRVGHQRILGLLDAALARERTVVAGDDLDPGILRHHLAVTVAEILEGGRAARPHQERDLAFAAELLGGPFRDVAADLLLVHGDMDGLVGRGRAARHRDDRDLCGCRGIVSRIHADRVDRRDQDALHAARDQILHAVDLFQLVLVGGDRGHVPAELLGARADAAQHGDVERIVILRERDADGNLLLRVRGRRQRQRGHHERRGTGG